MSEEAKQDGMQRGLGSSALLPNTGRASRGSSEHQDSKSHPSFQLGKGRGGSASEHAGKEEEAFITLVARLASKVENSPSPSAPSPRDAPSPQRRTLPECVTREQGQGVPTTDHHVLHVANSSSPEPCSLEGSSAVAAAAAATAPEPVQSSVDALLEMPVPQLDQCLPQGEPRQGRRRWSDGSVPVPRLQDQAVSSSSQAPSGAVAVAANPAASSPGASDEDLGASTADPGVGSGSHAAASSGMGVGRIDAVAGNPASSLEGVERPCAGGVGSASPRLTAAWPGDPASSGAEGTRPMQFPLLVMSETVVIEVPAYCPPIHPFQLPAMPRSLSPDLESTLSAYPSSSSDIDPLQQAPDWPEVSFSSPRSLRERGPAFLPVLDDLLSAAVGCTLFSEASNSASSCEGDADGDSNDNADGLPGSPRFGSDGGTGSLAVDNNFGSPIHLLTKSLQLDICSPLRMSTDSER